MLNSKNSNWCFKHLWPLPRSRNRQGWEEKAGPRGWRRGGRRRRRRLEKQSWDRASTVFPFSPPDPGVCPPTACTEFVIPPPPALSSFYWGKTVLEGWAKWSCIVIEPPPLPKELRATQQPSTSLPQPRASQASQHSAFHNFTVDPSLCISCEDFGTGI